jgi:ketosteroid isomerase-like protein
MMQETGGTTDTLTAQKLDAARRFWEAFTREPVTLERFRRGDYDPLIEEFYTADVVFDLSAVPGWPEAQTYEGYEGVRRFYETWFGMFEEVSFELERLEAVGDFVLSVATQRGTGISSHTPVEWRNAYLATFRGSKTVRAQFFADPDDAVRAAGR